MNPTANGCARPGARTSAANGRRTTSSSVAPHSTRACCSSTCWTSTRPTALATPRKPTWWPLMRAPRCMTAASAPASTACRWAWWCQPRRRALHDEGEDFWPKRYAIWGRLVAQQPGQIAYSIIDSKAIGRFMPPVCPGVKADSLPRLAQKLGLDVSTFMATLNAYNSSCKVGKFYHTALDDCHTEGVAPAKTRLGPPHRHRAVLRLCAAPRRHLHLPGPEGGRHGRRALCRPAQPQPVCGRRNDGRQCAGQGLHGRCGHGRLAPPLAALPGAMPRSAAAGETPCTAL